MAVLFVDESFFKSEDAAGLREFAQCGECLARGASEHEGQSLTGEEAAKLQWTECAKCRSGTPPAYRR
jgi:hypothetical protein